MPIRIVETVTGATTEELRLGREAAERRADIVELRVDGVAGLDLGALLAERRVPVIVTCRPVWEGGKYDDVEPDRLRLLRRARALGAEFIDVEFRADWRSVAGPDMNDGLILSFHDFGAVPADLETIADGMARTGAEVVKIAATPRSLAECAKLASAGRRLRRGAIIGMGRHGVVTRVAPQRFNSDWTYAGPLADVGQIPSEALKDTFGVSRVSESPALFGVVGRPVLHSRSPQLHNAAFRHEAIDAVYAPLEAVDFADFLTFAAAFDVRGASVTAPFKGDAVDAADAADAAAQATRAANTLCRHGASWSAANTDIHGFLAPLEGLDMRGMNAAVIGAGGASRAVVHALQGAGASVTVITRADISRASEPWDLLVNATPVGTAPAVDQSVMAGRRIRARRVYDLVYTPAETQLIQDARRAGAETIGGMPMLVAQACRQFELWFGRPAPTAVYEAAASRLISYETDNVRRVR